MHVCVWGGGGVRERDLHYFSIHHCFQKHVPIINWEVPVHVKDKVLECEGQTHDTNKNTVFICIIM
jgi:hypothetical protein